MDSEPVEAPPAAPDPRRALRRAARRLDAAATLLDGRFHADGGALLLDGLGALEAVAAQVSDVGPAGPELAEAVTALRAVPLDDEAPAESSLAAAERALEHGRSRVRAVERAMWSPQERRTRDRLRWALVALSIGLVLLGAGYGVRRALRLRLTATASGTFHDDPGFGVHRVVDGNPDTEWLGRDAAKEHVTVTLSRPSHVRAVRILNARNPPFLDRAVSELEVEVFAGSTRVKSVRTTLPPATGRIAPYVARIEASGITSIKLTAHRHHGLGPGLAEVEVETD